MADKKLITLIVATLFLVAWTPNPPQGTSPLASKSYQFDGDCNEGDMVYNWTISGYPAQTQFVRPWQATDISIRGAELTVLSPPQGAFWWMIGNSASGDTMLFVPGDQRHGVNWYPTGTAFEFPGTNNATPAMYMDLHGGCISGHVSIMLTFYYTSP